jgi:5-methylcytosine-specific restriction protein B
MTDYGKATEEKIAEVVRACERHGSRSIIALAGVPGTGKSFIAAIAAQRFASDPLLVREIQFHQSFSYEEFMEGLRIDESSGINVVPGIFLEWNERALDDDQRRYVLLIEELTRANLPSVLGELMTYLEHRERPFVTVYGRKPERVANNITIIATFNPTDRTALELDTALIRRLRIIRFPPSTDQLREMLAGTSLGPKVVDKLAAMFDTCEKTFGDQYEHLMPFGHGIFADVTDEQPDLNRLWIERIQHLLHRPLIAPHPFSEVIERCYPWKDPDFKLP